MQVLRPDLLSCLFLAPPCGRESLPRRPPRGRQKESPGSGPRGAAARRLPPPLQQSVGLAPRPGGLGRPCRAPGAPPAAAVRRRRGRRRRRRRGRRRQCERSGLLPRRSAPKDYVPLAGGYGHGSSTISAWISRNINRDMRSGKVNYPPAFGEPPFQATRDLVMLPFGYGRGSGTTARWLKEKALGWGTTGMAQG
ncbi:unnamed protein product [Prorocentrum cordatum]|uniref:Uncharacterized protein n=1 Tax=Prorocentrum cordatum TaxID=2364126 RepID=A0ABN9RL98_9DINO|nr:unnamed protein product [Polarella glacialis]